MTAITLALTNNNDLETAPAQQLARQTPPNLPPNIDSPHTTSSSLLHAYR
jgi:hypothetical protein